MVVIDFHAYARRRKRQRVCWGIRPLWQGPDIAAGELKQHAEHLQPAGAEGYTAGRSGAGSRTLRGCVARGQLPRSRSGQWGVSVPHRQRQRVYGHEEDDAAEVINCEEYCNLHSQRIIRIAQQIWQQVRHSRGGSL
jgi:hypothetical protein